MNKEFSAGDIVFTRNGRQCTYVSRTEGGHVVSPMHTIFDSETGYEEVYSSGVLIESEVFKDEPVQLYSPRVESLEKEISEKQKQLQQINAELRQADASKKELLAKLGQVAVLQHIETFLNGGITHFVMVDAYGAVHIKAADAALKEGNGRYDRDIKLLTLFGDTKGDLQWRLNRYSDGSGGYTEVFPCVSEDEAKQQALGLVAATFEEIRKAGSYRSANALIDSARALGAPVPDDIVSKVRDIQAEMAAKEVAIAKERLQLAMDKLQKLRPVEA